MKATARVIVALIDVLLLPVLLLVAVLSRLVGPRRIDVGFGPEPLINSVHHVRALEEHGLSAESFVRSVYYITDAFDVRFDRWFPGPLKAVSGYAIFCWAVWRYRCLFVYFNGGPLGFQPLLQWFEPTLLRIAGLRTVVLAYGSDVQEMSRSPNLAFKHAMSIDYPSQRLDRRRIARKIDLWTRGADHVVGGCEWVDYMYHWDSLLLAHFCVDLEGLPHSVPAAAEDPSRPLRILHAPNHRAIKGTDHFVRAVEELHDEGHAIEVELLERVPNSAVREAIARADVIADQLIVGWYAMFAIEAMAMGRAVLCYLREDLERFYESAGLVAPGENPIVRCSPHDVKSAIRRLCEDRELLRDRAERGRPYIERHHSTQSVGKAFTGIYRALFP